MKINVSKKNIITAIVIISVFCIALGAFIANKSNVKFRDDYNQAFSFSEKKMIINYFKAVDEYVDIIEKSSDLTNMDAVKFLDENKKIIEEYEANKEKIKAYGDKYDAENLTVTNQKELIDILRKRSILTDYLEIDIKILETIEQLIEGNCTDDTIAQLKEKVKDVKGKYFILEK